MKVNGEEYTKNYLKHDALMNGAVISIEMDNTPNKARGVSDDDTPYSFSKNE